MKPDAIRKAHRLAKSLCHPQAFEIIRITNEVPLNVQEIADRLCISHSNASNRLGPMREAGVLNVDRVGKQRFYSPNAERIEHISNAVKNFQKELVA